MDYLVLFSGPVAKHATKGIVDGLKAMLVGHWIPSGPWTPNLEQARAIVPSQYQATFDRSCFQLWFPPSGQGETINTHYPAYIMLRGSRGADLGRVYFQPLTGNKESE